MISNDSSILSLVFSKSLISLIFSPDIQLKHFVLKQLWKNLAKYKLKLFLVDKNIGRCLITSVDSECSRTPLSTNLFVFLFYYFMKISSLSVLAKNNYFPAYNKKLCSAIGLKIHPTTSRTTSRTPPRSPSKSKKAYFYLSCVFPV